MDELEFKERVKDNMAETTLYFHVVLSKCVDTTGHEKHHLMSVFALGATGDALLTIIIFKKKGLHLGHLPTWLYGLFP